MAGHSKWANIKHRKERSDAIKGKIFSRLVKEIISAVRQGGPDPKNNSKLRLAIQRARTANLPNENIERNIKKATSADQADFTDMTYEFYGYGGVGIIAEGMTDNKNRASSEMRIATNKKGGTQANPGSVLFNFDRKGVIQVLKNKAIEDDLFLLVTEAGAEDFDVTEDYFVVTTPPELLFQVKENLDQHQIPCELAELQQLPKLYIECDSETQKLNLELIQYLGAR